jgi:hypothetical protein
LKPALHELDEHLHFSKAFPEAPELLTVWYNRKMFDIVAPGHEGHSVTTPIYMTKSWGG